MQLVRVMNQVLHSKLMALTAALEDKVIDTSDIIDTENGVISFYGKKVRDSKHGGYGKISCCKSI